MDRTFISRRHIRIPITWFVEYEDEGVFGTGVVRNFSVDGWHITTIESRPIHVGMSLALRVTLPNQPTAIHVETVTVQWVRGREFGVHVVSTSSAGEDSHGLVHSDRPIYESRTQPRLSASQRTEAHAQEMGNQESCSKTQGGVGGEHMRQEPGGVG
ncbi:MAG: hypothetical protein ABI988_14790 [Nitrospirota bacterium]